MVDPEGGHGDMSPPEIEKEEKGSEKERYKYLPLVNFMVFF